MDSFLLILLGLCFAACTFPLGHYIVSESLYEARVARSYFCGEFVTNASGTLKYLKDTWALYTLFLKWSAKAMRVLRVQTVKFWQKWSCPPPKIEFFVHREARTSVFKGSKKWLTFSSQFAIIYCLWITYCCRKYDFVINYDIGKQASKKTEVFCVSEH